MKTNAESHKLKLPIGFIAKIIAVGLLIGAQILFHKQIDQISWLPQKINGIHSFLIPSIVLSIVRFIIIILYNTKHANKPVRGNFVLGINRLTAVLNTVIALVAVMIMFGINPKEFITSMTIVAMAIAVLFRDYITNMVSGLIIMFSDQLSVGDRIQVSENRGRIIDITLVNLVLQNEEDDILMVPNNYVFNSTFLNLSAHQSSLFTVKFELPLSVSIHFDELEERLKLSLTTHPNLKFDQEDDFNLKVLELGKDYVRYSIDLHAITNSNRMHRVLENEILKEVIKFENVILKSS